MRRLSPSPWECDGNPPAFQIPLGDLTPPDCWQRACGRNKMVLGGNYPLTKRSVHGLAVAFGQAITPRFANHQSPWWSDCPDGTTEGTAERTSPLTVDTRLGI